LKFLEGSLNETLPPQPEILHRMLTLLVGAAVIAVALSDEEVEVPASGRSVPSMAAVYEQQAGATSDNKDLKRIYSEWAKHLQSQGQQAESTSVLEKAVELGIWGRIDQRPWAEFIPGLAGQTHLLRKNAAVVY
jgi:hypothetical protein